MASRSLKDLHEILVSAYTKAIEAYKIKYPNRPQPFITCTFRSNAEQDALYRQPHDGIDNNHNGIIDDKSEKVTQAKPGESPHNYTPSLAFDIAFINLQQKLEWSPELFKMFADIIKEKEHRVEWGGDWVFKDAPHFQLHNWRNYLPVKNI